MLFIPIRHVSNKIRYSVHNRLNKWLQQHYYSQLPCDCSQVQSIDPTDPDPASPSLKYGKLVHTQAYWTLHFIQHQSLALSSTSHGEHLLTLLKGCPCSGDLDTRLHVVKGSSNAGFSLSRILICTYFIHSKIAPHMSNWNFQLWTHPRNYIGNKTKLEYSLTIKTSTFSMDLVTPLISVRIVETKTSSLC